MFAGSANAVLVLDAPMDGDANDIVSGASFVVEPAGTLAFVPSPHGQALLVDGTATGPGLNYTVTVGGSGYSISFWLGQATSLTQHVEPIWPDLGGLYNSADATKMVVPQCNNDSHHGTLWHNICFDGATWVYPETTTSLFTAEFHHVVVTYDATTKLMNTYINGVLDVGPTDGSAAGTMTTFDHFRIGASMGQPVVPGAYDEVKVYNHVLDQSEVTALYIAGTPPTIDTDPVSQVVALGGNATFTVEATNPITGDSTGLTYLWYKDGSPTSETTDTLSITGVTSGDTGDYYCEVTLTANGETANSAVAILGIGAKLLYAPMDGDANDIIAPISTVVAVPGGVPAFVASDQGQALHVDGTASNPGVDYTSEITLDTGQFTVCFWINNEVMAASTYYDLVSIAMPPTYPTYDPGTQFLVIYGYSGDNRVSMEIELGEGATPATGGVCLDDSEYNYIVCTYDGVDARLYVDGVETVSITGLNTAFISTGPLSVGTSPGLPLPADYDEVVLYNYGLTGPQVEYLYTGLPACVTPPSYDATGDCKVNLDDFALFALVWLEDGKETWPELL